MLSHSSSAEENESRRQALKSQSTRYFSGREQESYRLSARGIRKDTALLCCCTMQPSCAAFQNPIPSRKLRLQVEAHDKFCPAVPLFSRTARAARRFRQRRGFVFCDAGPSSSDAAPEGGAKQTWTNLAVVRETQHADGRYGSCSKCGEPVVIPGLSHELCQHCGWVERPADELTAQDGDVVPSTGHHN